MEIRNLQLRVELTVVRFQGRSVLEYGAVLVQLAASKHFKLVGILVYLLHAFLCSCVKLNLICQLSNHVFELTNQVVLHVYFSFGSVQSLCLLSSKHLLLRQLLHQSFDLPILFITG